MPVYNLINPSDAYTLIAPNVQIAGVAAALLSSSYGAEDVVTGESSPVLFGWETWLSSHQIDDAWVQAHGVEIAAAMDSLLIGTAGERAEVDATLKRIPESERAAWLAERHDRRRSSMNDIRHRATLAAERMRMRMRHTEGDDGQPA